MKPGPSKLPTLPRPVDQNSATATRLRSSPLLIDDTTTVEVAPRALADGLIPLLTLLVKVGQLAPLASAIQDAVACSARAEHQPEYVDKATLAKELSTSATNIDRLCREGLPYVRLGDVKRFRMADVRVWLAQRSSGP